MSRADGLYFKVKTLRLVSSLVLSELRESSEERVEMERRPKEALGHERPCFFVVPRI